MSATAPVCWHAMPLLIHAAIACWRACRQWPDLGHYCGQAAGGCSCRGTQADKQADPRQPSWRCLHWRGSSVCRCVNGLRSWRLLTLASITGPCVCFPRPHSLEAEGSVLALLAASSWSSPRVGTAREWGPSLKGLSICLWIVDECLWKFSAE